MDGMIDLFSTILKITVIGGFVLLVLKLIQFRKSSAVKAEILNLEARLSKLRMALKAKLKKKSGFFRASIKVAIAEGDPVDTMLKQLMTNNFEVSQDFQNYFDISRKIVSLIYAEKNGAASTEANIENDFMCSDFKTELDIVRIIKEMVNITAKINGLIEENNTNNPSNPIAKVDKLAFTSLTDINRIFSAESGKNPSDPTNSATGTSTPSTKKVA